jgi:hypothetical protein
MTHAQPNPATPADTQNAVRTLVPLLTDRARSAFELCDLTGLSLDALAQIVESEAVQSALTNLRRIARVRHDFLTAEADLIATGALLDLANAPTDSPRAADQSRKAAKELRARKPARPVKAERIATQDPEPPTNPTPDTDTPAMRNVNRGVPQAAQPAPSRARATTMRPSPTQLRAANGSDRPP